MKARDVMTTQIWTASQDVMCDVPARIMWERDCGGVPIVDAEQKVVGIVTDRDLAMCAYTKNRRLSEIPVTTAMARKVIAAREDDELRQVEQMMQANQIRRIPVLDGAGRVRGIISFADIARRRGAASTHDVSANEIATTLDAVSRPHAPR